MKQKIELEETLISRRNFEISTSQKVEEEPDLQDLYENNNYYKELDLEDFALDRGWWYRCRDCGLETRLYTKVPRCAHCGFKQKIKN